jgi:hypothetical protein
VSEEGLRYLYSLDDTTAPLDKHPQKAMREICDAAGITIIDAVPRSAFGCWEFFLSAHLPNPPRWIKYRPRPPTPPR